MRRFEVVVMLDWLDEQAAARRIQGAVDGALAESASTPRPAGTVAEGTRAAARAVAERLVVAEGLRHVPGRRS
jgi:isocitrate/isopropylmalate dehydrogenase